MKRGDHVGESGTVSDGERFHSWAIEFNKFSNDILSTELGSYELRTSLVIVRTKSVAVA